MDEVPQDYEIFDLGEFELQSGAVVHGGKLAYKTFGELNADRSNAIVYPTWYSGFHWDNEWLIGDGMALDPAKYFIVVPNMLGNGLSSSPSQHAAAVRPRALPARDLLRPGAGPAQARDRAVRDRDARAGHRLVDGRRADLPVGGQLPGHGPAGVPVLRLLEDQRAQLRLPRGRQGGADRRRGLQGGLVRRAADPRAARRRARLRRLGLLAGLLLGPGLQGHGPLAPARPGPRLPVAGGLPGLVLGGPLPGPAARRQRPAVDALDLAVRATSATRRASTATTSRPCSRSRRG